MTADVIVSTGTPRILVGRAASSSRDRTHAARDGRGRLSGRSIMRFFSRSIGLAAIIAASAAVTPLAAQQAAPAQVPAYKRDLPAKLLAQATVPESTAAVTAAAKVPGGAIQAVELE